MAMTIDKLWEAAQKTVVTKEDVRNLSKRLADAEKRFEDERRTKESDPQGFLNFQCTL